MEFVVLGFLIKLITGFDDTVTRVPIVSGATRTLIGKLAFVLGMILATILSIILAIFFADFLEHLPYERFLVSGLLFLFAAGIWFDIFVHHPKKKLRSQLTTKTISLERFTTLVGLGFFASVITTLDDIVAYVPILIDPNHQALAITGILLATGLEAAVILFAAEFISKLKYRDEIASVSLTVLGLLVLLGII